MFRQLLTSKEIFTIKTLSLEYIKKENSPECWFLLWAVVIKTPSPCGLCHRPSAGEPGPAKTRNNWCTMTSKTCRDDQTSKAKMCLNVTLCVMSGLDQIKQAWYKDTSSPLFSTSKRKKSQSSFTAGYECPFRNQSLWLVHNEPTIKWWAYKCLYEAKLVRGWSKVQRLQGKLQNAAKVDWCDAVHKTWVASLLSLPFSHSCSILSLGPTSCSNKNTQPHFSVRPIR